MLKLKFRLLIWEISHYCCPATSQVSAMPTTLSSGWNFNKNFAHHRQPIMWDLLTLFTHSETLQHAFLLILKTQVYKSIYVLFIMLSFLFFLTGQSQSRVFKGVVPWISVMYFMELQVSLTLDLADRRVLSKKRIFVLLIEMERNPGVNLLTKHLSMCSR